MQTIRGMTRLLHSSTIGGIANWGSFIQILIGLLSGTTLFGWIASSVEPIRQLGLSAIVLAGLVLVCLLFLTLSLTALAWRYFWPVSIERATDEPARLAPDRYLATSFVAEGLAGSPPEFRARFAKNGRNGSFYVEYSSLSRGFGSRWTQRRVKLLRQVERFIKDEDVTIPLFGVVSTPEGPRWHWAPAEVRSSGYPDDMIGINWIYRGRVRFVTHDDFAEHSYFVALTRDHSEMPSIIGEYLFSHRKEWEDGDGSN